MNTAIIYKLISLILLFLSGGFAFCIAAGFANGERLGDASIQAFFFTIVITLSISVGFHVLGRNGDSKFFRREALCAIGLSWIVVTLIGSIPYLLIVENCDVADAIFESTSGITTTGATAFDNFYEFPHSLLFWRSLSQWFGGLGVVVLFVALLGSLGAGAKILFSSESTGTSSDFEHGRIQSAAKVLMLFYMAISILCMFAYRAAGMNWFQAINHAMTTVATGGFSTEPSSIEAFASPLIEWIAITFMLLGGTTFVFMLRLLRGQTHILRTNNEVYWYYAIIFASTSLLTLYAVELTGELPDHHMVRMAAFQCVSIMTTTGYSSTDFDLWLSPAKMLLIILMVIGGCSGSTSGGVKVVRIVIAVRAAVRSVVHSFRPNITIPMRMGGQVLNERTIQSAVIFLMLMATLQVLSMLFVSAVQPELSFMSVFSCVQATLFNIGPGFEAVGPTQSFQFLKSTTKIFLSFLMILGRLELYAIMILFVPTVWKRFA